MLTYQTFTECTDNGPYVTKLILDMPQEVRAEQVSTDTFSVYVERIDNYTDEVFMTSRVWRGPKIYPSRGYRPVTAAYPCDEQGKRQYAGTHVALEMPYGPIHPLGQAQAPLRNDNMNEFVVCRYRVTQVTEIPDEVPLAGLVFDEFAGDICPQLAGWAHGVSHFEPQPLRYGFFSPDLEQARAFHRRYDGHYGDEWEHEFPEKLPLVVWLHGAGEGGSDPMVAYTGNKVVALSTPEIQRRLGGAAYVLAPQAPTFWLDNGTENPRTHENLTDCNSRYTEALKACIDEFVEAHPDIDRDRIYLGGCSNGGFMTVKMILTYSNYFAAAFPVCEAYRNSGVSEQDIANLRHLPIWLVQAENDPLVPPECAPLPLYQRLRAAGNDNVHMTLFEKVEDKSGLFKDEQGRPWTYIPHFSWVHALNDDVALDLDGSRVLCDGRPVTLMRWLGCQRLS